jgi:hypothetical protein
LLFFWRKLHEAALWVHTVFCFCERWLGSKQPQERGLLCAISALGIAKNVTENNNRRDGVGKPKKDCASPERFILSEGRGFFRLWENPAELPVNK